MAAAPQTEDDRYFELLCHAAKRGKADQLKSLLEKYSVKNHYSKRDEAGQAPIHYAAAAGQVECAKLLLNKDSDLINARTKKDGMTALHLAAKKGHNDVIELLLQNGGSVDVRDKEKNQTPLHLACYYGHSSTVQLLLKKGANALLTMSGGQLPVDRAAVKGHTSILALFSALAPDAATPTPPTVRPPNGEAPFLRTLSPDPLEWLRPSLDLLASAFSIIEADFDFFESDGDGCISMSEVVSGFQQMPGNIPHKFVVALFAEVDKENRGYIGESEFVSLMYLWIRNRQASQKLVEHHNAQEAKVLTDSLELLDRLFAQYADGAQTMKREKARDLLYALDDAPARAAFDAAFQKLNLPAVLTPAQLQAALYTYGLPQTLRLQLTWANCPSVPKFGTKQFRLMSTASYAGLAGVLMEQLSVKSMKTCSFNFVPKSGPNVLIDSEDALTFAVYSVLQSDTTELRLLVAEYGTGAKAPSAAGARRKAGKQRNSFVTPTKAKPSTPQSMMKLDITVQQLSRKDRPKYDWEISYSEIQFVSRVGAGGYGEVWLANWKGRQVAAKTIKPAAGDNPQLLASFLREIGLLTQLKHPNIVVFEAACLQLESICYLTEYIPNGSLYAFLRKGPIEWPMKLKMALTGARGMLFLHSCVPPIIHRDLKSHNLLVDKDYVLKVCDFGISKILEHDETTNTKLGTLSWMAPEAVLDSKYTKESDVYSYGMVLWEILTCLQPFHDVQSPIKIMGRIIEGERPQMPADVDPAYAALIKRSWDFDPHHRGTFEAMIKDLERMASRLSAPP